MGRHANSGSGRRPAPRWAAALVGVLGLAVVAVVGLPQVLDRSADVSEPCDVTTTVRLVTSPDIAPVVDGLLTDPVEYDGGCARGVSRTVEPAAAGASLAALQPESRPELWIPDSTVWLARVGSTPVQAAGNVASTPVVLGTSREAVETLGWAAAPPTWGQALATGRALAVPDLATSAEGIAALAAVRMSLGDGPDAERAVVRAALAASRGDVPTAAQGLATAAQGGAEAPLVPLTEQAVLQTNAQRETRLVAVYPDDGTPFLDYPVIRVGEPDPEPDEQKAVDAVVARLTSDAARDTARRAGFRDPAGLAPVGAGVDAGVSEPAPAAMVVDPEEVQALLHRLSSLAMPSRVLAVIDVSTSMSAEAGPGQTRITLARDAAKGALGTFPETSSIGLWVFASRLDGQTDYVELAATRPLTDEVDGSTQREVLGGLLETLPNRLARGGTSLYDTTLAAVRSVQSGYDSEAVNTVVMITDGRNEDSAGIDLDELIATLQAERDPDRPVQVVAVGLGPDADNEALKQIAEATGGGAYSANDPRDLQTVLFDALSQRS